MPIDKKCQPSISYSQGQGDSLFLRPNDTAQQPVDLVRALFQRRCVLFQRGLLCRNHPPGLAFHHDVEIDQFILGIVKAERVFAELLISFALS